MIKNFTITFLCFLSVAFVLVSCSHEPFRRHYITADQVVSELDTLYIHLEGVGYIRSARIYTKYEKEKIADFHITFSEVPSELPVGSGLAAINKNRKAAKELFMTELRGLDGNNRVLFDSLANFNYSARFNISADNDTTTAIVILSPKEIKEALSRHPYSDRYDLALDAFCKIMNIQMPQDIDAITKWVSVTMDQNYLIFKYEVNDSQNPISTLDYAEYKQNMIRQYGQVFKNIEKILWNTVATDRGIKYVYVGLSSGESAVVNINEKELRDVYFELCEK